MREIHVTCPICSSELVVWEGAEGPVGTCQACGTRVEVPVGAFAVLAARPDLVSSPPAQAGAPAQVAAAEPTPPPAPEVVDGDLIRWDEQTAGQAVAAPPAQGPAEGGTPPPAEAPASAVQIEGEEEGEEGTDSVVFDLEDEEEGKADSRSSTNLDLFEPQGGERGMLVDQYFRRSPYAGRRARTRLLLILGALALLCVAVWGLLLLL